MKANHEGATLHIRSSATTQSEILFDGDWPGRLREFGTRRLIVADEALGAEAQHLADMVEADQKLTVNMSEEAKTLNTVGQVYAWLGRVNATRDAVVVAAGGGVCTDLVGYAAATYLRGLSWAAVPTTLLAQVDAAIGGKVGVNTEWGKNLVGAFHLPRFVVVDPDFLSTLPVRQWRAGLGEVIKSALIRGGWLYEHLDSVRLKDIPAWRETIYQTVKVKVDIVNQDLYEEGPRMFLNFGHTVGHALENLLGYGTLTHGEAVGLGTLVALVLSERVRGLATEVRQQVMTWMGHWGLPTRLEPIQFTPLWEQMHRDKKARVSGLTWVLLDGVGSPCLVKDVPEAVVREAVLEVFDR
ncbi:MAG: 3-dehydroquinate synthase [Sulfobacillus acidophilus]|uniref:3-dehydroquinate synthase n=1 Tax=Sulfobacillus acidophilus TaxID=53633 RepID=A0A2T2WPH7_9FIRM|nr:MAG: 3-dehydroquinate synthase [Sulfobacillus acidophilus]